MTNGQAIMYLLGLVERRHDRPIRANELYLFIRRCKGAFALPDEVSDAFDRTEYDYDASLLFLIMEKLREEELLSGSGSGFRLAPKGVEVVVALPRSVELHQFERVAERLAA